MKDRYIPAWEQAKNSGEDFKQTIENTRSVFRNPLTNAYHQLAQDQIVESDLLCLGIGTGNEIQYSGLNPKRVTGIDVSPTFLNVARMRIPEAKLLQGKLQDVLPSLPKYPVALASEVLDCINTQELPEVLSQIRQKTDKLVVTQTFSPDNEFYSSYYPDETFGSCGGPGIEGWTESQQQTVQKRMDELGVDASYRNPQRLITQLQKAAEKNMGSNKLNCNVVEMLKDLKLDVRRIPYDILDETYGNRIYPSQVEGFMQNLVGNIAQLRDRSFAVALKSGDERKVAQYVKLHTTHRLVELLHSSLIVDYHFTILEEELRQAGFTSIQRKTISASSSNIIDEPELVKNINRSINAAKSQRLPGEHITRGINSSVFVSGAAMTFYEPFTNPINDARIQYVVAE